MLIPLAHQPSAPSIVSDKTIHQEKQSLRPSQLSSTPVPTSTSSASASPSDAPRPPSLLLRVFYALLLFPLLYAIHQLVVQPVGRTFGRFLVSSFHHPPPSLATGESTTESLHWLGKREVEKGTAEFGVFAALIPILVILSGIFAGLTLGYMSLDMTQLSILATSGTEKQKAAALKVMPVRKNGHQLLTTLLLVNMIVNETLPIIADPVLGGGVQAVVVSTVLIIIFAEIIPQSICTRYGLQVGAKAAGTTKVLLIVMYPIAKPVALLLEAVLGAHHGVVYRKAELRELLQMHANTGQLGGDLNDGTVVLTQGALDLQDKNVRDAMTPIEDVFMLEDTTKLDYEVLSRVVHSGHSRIPVFKFVTIPDLSSPGKSRQVRKILGTMLVKNCVLLDPEDATPILSIPINRHFPSVPQDTHLLDMMNAFRQGSSHMAFISRRTKQVLSPTVAADDDTLDARSVISSSAIGLRERIKRKLHIDSDSSSDSSSDEEEGVGMESKEERKKSRKELKKAKKREEREKKAEKDRLQDKKEGQGLPRDAQVTVDVLDELVEDMDGEPIGIITLEDVLEELIGNEIEDEYDLHDANGNATEAYIPAEAQEAIARAEANRQRTLSGTTVASVAPVEKSKTMDATTGGGGTGKLSGVGKLLGGRKASSVPGRKRSLDSQRATEAAFAATANSSGFDAPATIAEKDKTARPDGSENDEEIPRGATGDGGSIDKLYPVPKSHPADTKTVNFAPISTSDSPENISPDLFATAGSPEIVSPLPIRAGVAHSSADLTTGPISPSPGASISAPPTPALVEAIERGRKRTLGAVIPAASSSVAAARSRAATPVATTGGKKMLFKSTPTTGSTPNLAKASTFSGDIPLSEEPKNI